MWKIIWGPDFYFKNNYEITYQLAKSTQFELRGLLRLHWTVFLSSTLKCYALPTEIIIRALYHSATCTVSLNADLYE